MYLVKRELLKIPIDASFYPNNLNNLKVTIGSHEAICSRNDGGRF